MKFGPVPVDEAEGAVLAHSLRLAGLTLKKGRVLSAEDVAALSAEGLERVVVARFEPGDIDEDTAADAVAAAVAGENLTLAPPFTGRVNLTADRRGLLVVDTARLDALNAIHEGVTVATLPPFAPVEPRQMVATVKIIPFAIPGSVLRRCVEAAESDGPPIRLAPYRAKTVALVQTTLPGTRARLLDNTASVVAGRIEALGGRLAGERRCDHDSEAVAAAIRAEADSGVDLVLVAGASAIVDRGDVIPAAIEAAGGEVEHFGMPVDPGNLLLIGRVPAAERTVPVVGLPGCARSPKLNGFDWVLRRLVADLPVGRAEITAMGVGGFLKDIPSRPHPRAEAPVARPRPAAGPRRIAAVVLAAGRSRRMGGANKLLAEIRGRPMVAWAVDAALRSQADPVYVVTGHESERVREALAGREVAFVHNPDYAEGLSASLAAGLAALPPDVEAAVVCLGDMPRVRPSHIDRLIAAFDPDEGRAICVPTSGGKRGNPVLWARRFFAEIRAVSGDVGARHLIGQYEELVVEVEMGDGGVLVDVDSPAALAEVSRAPRRFAPT